MLFGSPGSEMGETGGGGGREGEKDLGEEEKKVKRKKRRWGIVGEKGGGVEGKW